jgi:hypothetical protein
MWLFVLLVLVVAYFVGNAIATILPAWIGIPFVAAVIWWFWPSDQKVRL